MNARDVMVAPVVVVKPTATVKDVARLFLEKHVSAVPVIGSNDKLIGIVSEGDLLQRAEIGTEPHRPWWLQHLVSGDKQALEYVRSHAVRVADIMTKDVITARPETPLYDIASLMEKNAVKRIPILENERLVGIVSRANLIQAIATARPALEITLSDTAVRDRLLAHLGTQPWAHTSLLNVTVSGGVVDLWGLTESEAERTAIRVAAESTLGVHAVNDNLVTRPVLAH